MKASEILKSKLLDVIFENRNKKYGAYFLRNRYERNLKVSIGIVLLSAIAIIGFFKFMPKKVQVEDTYAIPVTIELEHNIFEKKIEKKIEKVDKKIIKKIRVKTAAYTAVKAVIDNKVKEEQKVATKDELKTVAIGNQTIKDGADPTGDITDGTVTNNGVLDVPIDKPIVVEPEVVKPVVKIYEFAEVNPSYVGGTEAMMKFLSKNIVYPIYGRENNMEGKVIVQFIVDEKGVVTNPIVLRGMGGEFDENAINAVRKMPKWNPGMQRGIPVKVKFTIPISYKLNK